MRLTNFFTSDCSHSRLSLFFFDFENRPLIVGEGLSDVQMTEFYVRKFNFYV